MNIETLRSARLVMLADQEWYRVHPGSLTVVDGEVRFHTLDIYKAQSVPVLDAGTGQPPLMVTTPDRVMAAVI